MAVISGKLQAGTGFAPQEQYNTLVLSAQPGENGVLLTRPEGTDTETRFILCAGEPLDQPVVQVSSPSLTNGLRHADVNSTVPSW